MMEMNKYTTMKIHRDTMKQLVRSRGLIQYYSKEKITFDKAILYLCDFFEKNNKFKLGDLRWKIRN